MRYIVCILSILLSIVYAETFEQCRARLNTPTKIGNFVKYEVKYVYVPTAVPYRSAEEVFRSRTGGCTDKAQFAYEMLKYHGYTTGIYEMWNATRGHAFVVYVNNEGTYSAIDSIYGQQSWNRYLVTTIAKLIYQNYGGYTGIKFVKGYQNWDLRS